MAELYGVRFDDGEELWELLLLGHRDGETVTWKRIIENPKRDALFDEKLLFQAICNRWLGSEEAWRGKASNE